MLSKLMAELTSRKTISKYIISSLAKYQLSKHGA